MFMAYNQQGHGTLHAIYASIERACAVKGWPGVDLFIIGGDFQVLDFPMLPRISITNADLTKKTVSTKCT